MVPIVRFLRQCGGFNGTYLSVFDSCEKNFSGSQMRAVELHEQLTGCQ